MPIYEFICSKCHLKFEKIYSKINANQKELCPVCYSDSDKVISMVNHKFAEPTHIPKDLDKKVGKDAEKRWLEYEERQKVKDKVRQEAGTQKLSRDPDGNYAPFTMTKDGQKVSETEGVTLRKEMFQDYSKIIHDPETTKFEVKD